MRERVRSSSVCGWNTASEELERPGLPLKVRSVADLLSMQVPMFFKIKVRSTLQT